MDRKLQRIVYIGEESSILGVAWGSECPDNCLRVCVSVTSVEDEEARMEVKTRMVLGG